MLGSILLLIPLTMGVVKATLSRSCAPGDSEFDEENPQDQNQQDQNQSQPFLTRHSPTFNDGGEVVAGETTDVDAADGETRPDVDVVV